ncbi:hypothetical protein ABD74_20885 [Brevibacillus laterosporus]|nr:hypothetical protein [Brevibacillus laterosporus]
MEEETEKEIALKTKLSVTPEERIKNTKLSPDHFARNARKIGSISIKNTKKCLYTLFSIVLK